MSPPGHPSASPEDVARIHDHYRRLVERVGEPEREPLFLEALSAGEQALYVLIAACEQIQLGGFEQLFVVAPALAPLAPDAAALVKARRFQRLFEQANAVAFDEPPRKRASSEFRRMVRAVESSGERLTALDEAFDGLMADAHERIETHLVRYAESVPHEFKGLGER
ncbi:DUF4375 domain-containing protein [Solirubrobacter sp. CPCC 204708]|uniref:DUF4375 domain-containing protein n=1 Tax=Solirubrobacter deserti TaxID=2282478 RepID=A0ABT4RUJ5_9ACTN|nr:DUF4375 domain-containing protein [Solirubrobacter deserti]MBE2320961.1 DUF4375 domain-containing protein [Solirubrobacter deserti]MDA0142256.1 DUF4375 domain-containing protein [Solirubrobacter deserti]